MGGVPRQVDHGERRGQIAAALLRVVAAQGLGAVSLRQVAGEAGVTSGMVQHYFPSKDSMIEHAMRAASEGFEQRITAALGGLCEPSAPRDVARAVLTTMLPLREEGVADGRVALGFLAHAALHPELAGRLAVEAQPLRDFLAAQVRAAHVDEDMARPGQPDDVAVLLLATAEGLSALMLGQSLSGSAAMTALDAQLDLVFGDE